MSEASAFTNVVEVPAAGHSAGASEGVIDISGRLMLLTWITFFVMAYVLFKVAWKPILKGLDMRERSIRKALEEAAKAREELEEVEARGKRQLAETQARAEEMMIQARAAAAAAAAAAEKQARDETRAMLEDAHRQIQAATEKARARLREDSADLAVALAGKLIGERIDAARDTELVERLAKEI